MNMQSCSDNKQQIIHFIAVIESYFVTCKKSVVETRDSQLQEEFEVCLVKVLLGNLL